MTMKSLSPSADMAWRIAAHEAAASGYRFIEKEHLLAGIVSIEKVIADGPGQAGFDQNAWQDLKAEHSLLKRVLRSYGIDQTKLRRMIRQKLGNGGYKHTERTIHRSEECKEVFTNAAVMPDTKLITTLHLAAAIAGNPGDILTTVFAELAVDPKALRYALLSPPEKAPVQGNEDQMNNAASQSYLERYGRDLTQAAKEGKLDPFIGRRNELLQVIQTLARSMKCNPVLIGEAGVGKTAIVEALAVRAFQGKDPQVISGKRIIELNLGALLGGTKYRGEFEERLTRIIEEAKADPNIIIFIDEIHNLVGAGNVGGSMDAANIMKPALARGVIKCIGATTIGEYRRYIESDPALERRFEKIIVNEPSRDETIEILKGIRPKWEDHFNRKITDKALESAVDLSIRFDADHNLPDKAIDLVDKAGARIRVFDDGRITDSKGRTVDAKNSIFVMTSNIQPETTKKLGFLAKEEKETEEALLKGVKEFFRPELINRIDEQIVFHPLSEDNVGEILKTILNEISGDITERCNVTLEYTEEAEKCIAHKGYSPEYGVRELRRTVEKLIQIPLSNLILSGKLKEHKEWRVVCSNEEISLVPRK